MILITQQEVKEIQQKTKRLPKIFTNPKSVYLIQAFATFIYTYGFSCSIYQHPFKDKIQNPYGIFLISSFLYFALSIAAPFSGGHLNPAVTMMMFFSNKISKERVKYYITAQLVGALLGSALAFFSFDIIPAPYITQQEISFNLFLDGLGSFIGSFIFTFFVLYAIDTNYMRGDYFMYFFISIMFLIGRIFTFRKWYINPVQIFSLQIFAAIDHSNFFLAFWGLLLILGSLLGGIVSAIFYKKLYFPLMQAIKLNQQ